MFNPKYQRMGIGTQLIEKTKGLVKKQNIPAIVIYGDPHNYCKHGFKNGYDYKVSNMDGQYPLGLLVLELQKGFFGQQNWKAKQSDVYNFDNKRVVEFDKNFKEKTKKKQYSQEIFQMQIRAFIKSNCHSENVSET